MAAAPETVLAADLAVREYGRGVSQVSILLEKEQHMRARSLAGPEEADALALTFAEAVAPGWPEPAAHWRRQEARRDVEEEWADLYRELREEG